MSQFRLNLGAWEIYAENRQEVPMGERIREKPDRLGAHGEATSFGLMRLLFELWDLSAAGQS